MWTGYPLKKKLLVLALVAVCYCCFFYCSVARAELLEEGETIVEEIETEHLGEGHIDTVTQTITIIENQTTGDILHADQGLVGNTKEGDMDSDWGGIGPAKMHSTCPSQEIGSGKCAEITGSTLTTFDQYVDISNFHITQGGALDWELSMHFYDTEDSAYFQTKGYSNNVLQWDTGEINLQNNNNATTYTGSYDFDNSLDRVFVRVGGVDNTNLATGPLFDNVSYTVNYNVITTVVNTWIEIVQPMQMQESIQLELMDTYESATVEEQQEMETEMQNMDTVMHFDLKPTISMGSMDDVQGMPETLSVGVVEGLFQDVDMGEMSMQEVMVEVETMVEEIQNIGMEVETVAVKMPEQELEVVINNVEPMSEPVEEPKIEAPEPKPVEVAQEEVKETVEVADKPMQTTPEVKEEVKEESSSEEETATSNTVKVKKVAKEQDKPKEEKVAKEEPKEKPVAKEVNEEKPKETVEEKPTKEQEKKQEKANQIIAGLPNSYDPVSQITTLALVNALGPNITTYQNAATVVQPTWYVSEDIYTDSIMPDPLGSYLSVRSNLQIEKMIGQQYE
jgi:hypothetical protein